jgi:hypothetical protein
LIPPTVPEVRRLIRAMMGPEEKREFLLWDGHSFVGPTRPWQSAVTRQLIEQNTPPTMMVVEDVTLS